MPVLNLPVLEITFADNIGKAGESTGKNFLGLRRKHSKEYGA